MPDATDGRWEGAKPFSIPSPTVQDGDGHSYVDTRGLFVLHAALLPTGKVICFSGHVENSLYAPLCYLFDPENESAQMRAIDFPSKTDLFCCHYVNTPDGLVAMGGSQHDVGFPDEGMLKYHYRGSTGSQAIGLFDPRSETWKLQRGELKQGRWYPTPVTLPDGRIAVFSGRRELDDNGAPPADVTGNSDPEVRTSHVADMVEILSPPSWFWGSWTSDVVTGSQKALSTYPGLHLAPNGRIYFTHCTWGQEVPNHDLASIEIGDGQTSATWKIYPGVKPPHPRREEGTSVLLPPAQDGKILVVGGTLAVNAAGDAILGAGGGGRQAYAGIADPADAVAADILDTLPDPPTWTSVGPTKLPRINAHCVILPDATVLICGGHDRYKWNKAPDTHSTLQAEIYDRTAAAGSQFRAVATMSAPRRYHSVALLLPDGRVFTAGGADPDRDETLAPYPPDWRGRVVTGVMPLNDRTYEIYKPPYFFKTPRPKIDRVTRAKGADSGRIEYGEKFNIITTQAPNIGDVAFIRLGACTHHTDSEQRFVRLDFSANGTALTVTAPSDRKIAPPGYYMLWIVDKVKIPCEKASIVRLLPKGSTC